MMGMISKFFYLPAVLILLVSVPDLQAQQPTLASELNIANTFRSTALIFRKENNEVAALRQFDLAIRKYRDIIARYPYAAYPGVTGAYADLASIYFNHLRKPDLALPVWKQLLALTPNDSTAIILLGQTYYELKNHDEALRAFARALSLNPKPEMKAIAHKYNGYIYRARKQHDKELIEAQLALLADPTDGAAAHSVGIASYYLKSYPKAIAAFQQAIQLKYFAPEQSYNWMATIYNELRQYDKTILILTEALKSKRDYPSTYQNLGTAYYELKQYGDAIRSYEEVLRLDPNRAATAHSLGMACYYFKNYSKAIGAFRKAIQLKYERSDFSYGWIGDSYVAYSQNELALEAYKEAVRIKADYDYAINRMGQTLIALNRPAEALTAFQNAARLKPKDPVYHYNIGFAYVKLRQKAEAMAAYERLLVLDQVWAKKLIDLIDKELK